MQREDDTDAESVQEAAPDPGMGHLIAGGFGSADSIGVSSVAHAHTQEASSWYVSSLLHALGHFAWCGPFITV